MRLSRAWGCSTACRRRACASRWERRWTWRQVFSWPWGVPLGRRGNVRERFVEQTEDFVGTVDTVTLFPRDLTEQAGSQQFVDGVLGGLLCHAGRLSRAA